MDLRASERASRQVIVQGFAGALSSGSERLVLCSCSPSIDQYGSRHAATCAAWMSEWRRRASTKEMTSYIKG